MELKKVFLPLLTFIGIAVLIALFAIEVKSRDSRLQANQDLTAVLHKMRLSLATTSEALGNAVLTKSETNAEKFGQDAIHGIKEFKAGIEQVEKGVQETSELQLLQDIKTSFARFEEVCDKLVLTSKQNSNRKAYALTTGPCLDLVKKIDAEFASFFDNNRDGLETPSNLRGIEFYEARLALLRIQSILVRHIFETTDEVMDALESELQLEKGRIKSSLSSVQLPQGQDGVQKIADIRSHFMEFESLIAEVISLSRQNSNVHAEDIAMTSRLEATLDCETKLSAFEQMLHRQLDSLIPKGRGK